MSAGLRRLYTDLLIKSLANAIYGDPPVGPWLPHVFDPKLRQTGEDWPSLAHSMVGLERLGSLRDLTQMVLDEKIPGDFIETGVWRGGCCILMKGVLAANQVRDRKVYVADSFAGLPHPDAAYPADHASQLYTCPELAVPVEQVRANFAAYGLLDDSIIFVPGYFQDTLPTLRAGPFALIRLDGDMYESTIVALDALYPRLSAGGVVVIDDYGAIEACKQAVIDYRARHAIDAPIHQVDWTGVWWRKPVRPR
jgi:O-methyltransferase